MMYNSTIYIHGYINNQKEDFDNLNWDLELIALWARRKDITINAKKFHFQSIFKCIFEVDTNIIEKIVGYLIAFQNTYS